MGACWIILRAQLSVMGDKQIEVSVPIDVAPGTAGAQPAGVICPWQLYASEGPITIVVKKSIFSVAGEAHIDEAVVVVVRGGYAHRVTIVEQARCARHLRE